VFPDYGLEILFFLIGQVGSIDEPERRVERTDLCGQNAFDSLLRNATVPPKIVKPMFPIGNADGPGKGLLRKFVDKLSHKFTRLVKLIVCVEFTGWIGRWNDASSW
jgi:hypothetical protein